MDALSELLSSVRSRSASWTSLDARAPWGIALRARPEAFCIHHVVSGTAWFSAEDHALDVRADDVIVVPHGQAHALRDRQDSPVIPLDGRAERITLGGAGIETKITSVLIELEDPFSAPVVSSLPSVFRLAGHAVLAEQLHLLRREMDEAAFGSDLVLARMADVLFVRVMRAYVETIVEPTSHSCRSLERVSALRDPSVATALSLMSREPAHAWTVASLAERAGLSRSAFASRFTSLVGETPVSFLTRMRMQKAAALLREGATLAMTSQLTGYASEGSFSHAFRQWSGMSPGAYRRQEIERTARA